MSETQKSGALRRASAMIAVALGLMITLASPALAHCDTMDGPVVAAAKSALESGTVAKVLIWVRPRDEAAIRGAFQQTLTVRKLGPDARRLADYYFFETVVRLHREGEGEPYTGLKPAGTEQRPAIAATDHAIATGSPSALEQLLLHGVREGLETRFERATAAARFVPDDVAGGRAYVEAYVALLHYVEALDAATAGGLHGSGHQAGVAGAHKTP